MIPLLLKTAELPDTCYVQEVVYWIAFGRVPAFMPYEEHDDVRAHMEAIVSGDGNGLDWYDQGFDEHEFLDNGIEIDHDRYINGHVDDLDEFRRYREGFIAALEKTDWTPIREKFPEANSAEETAEVLKDMRATYEKDLAEAQWAHSMDRLLRPVINRAQAAVYQALATGQMKAFGYIETDMLKAMDEGRPPFDKRPYEHPEPEKLVRREEIPSAVWTWDDFDWRKSTLQTPNATYTHVQVMTDDMLNIFQTPNCKCTPLAAEAYGGVVMVRRIDAPRAPASNNRGRPPRGYSIKEAIQNWLKEKLKTSPDYATAPRETIIYDAINFAATILGQDISRPSVQSYIAEVLPAMPENMPKKAPDIPPEMEAAE